jgi:hypothetical protein
MMTLAHVAKNEGPYSYRASQNPDGTWTVNVQWSRRPNARKLFETEQYFRTYTAARLPSSPAAAWREATRDPSTRSGRRGWHW